MNAVAVQPSATTSDDCPMNRDAIIATETPTRAAMMRTCSAGST
jgi:hypothetical protein